MQQPSRGSPYVILLLRLTVGALFLAHLWIKFFVWGLSTWWGNLSRAGYPDLVIGYTLSAEFVGAIFITMGLGTRWASLYTLPMMIGATHYWAVRKGFYFTAAGCELPLVWCLLLVGLIVAGSGPLGIDNILERRGVAGFSRRLLSARWLPGPANG